MLTAPFELIGRHDFFAIWGVAAARILSRSWADRNGAIGYGPLRV